jgi:hypothetical protein
LVNKYKDWVSSQHLTLPTLNLRTMDTNFILNALVKDKIEEIHKKNPKHELKKIYFISDVDLPGLNERTDNIINVVVNEKSFVKDVKSFFMSLIELTDEEKKATGQK